MTTQNLFNLAKSGGLELHRFYNGTPPAHCIAAAVDCVFIKNNVPLSIYKANDREMQKVMAGDQTGIERFFSMLGKTVFNADDKDLPVESDYYFNTREELVCDLKDLRSQKATILIDVRNGLHSLGLKPVEGEEDEWEIVGIDQLVHVMSDGEVSVQTLRKPQPKTSEDVWDYMIQNNSDVSRPLTALVLPPEPA